MSTHKITSSSFGFFKRNFGFTLTELIVVITILAILTTIAFFMLSSYIDTARDSARVSDINTISKALTLYDAKVGSFPEPDGAINVSYGEGTSVWRQGKVGAGVVRNILMNKIALDPHFDAEYSYSLTPDKKSYQIASIIETSNVALNRNKMVDTAYAAGEYLAYIKGNYNEIATKVMGDDGTCDMFIAVPSIVLAELPNSITGIDLRNPAEFNSGSLVFMKKENIPASYSGYLSQGTSFAGKFSFKDFSGSGAEVLNGCDSAAIAMLGKTVCETKLMGVTIAGKVVDQAYCNTMSSEQKIAYGSAELAGNLKSYYGDGSSLADNANYTSFTQSADGTPLATLGSDIAINSLGIAMKPLSPNVTEGITFSCAAQPDILNADPTKYSTGNPTAFGQEWSYSNEPGACTFACKTGYAYDGAHNTCVLDICQGDLALLNGHMLDGSTQKVGIAWTHSDTANLCTYTCNDGYTWNGTMCAANDCDPRTILSNSYTFEIATAMHSGDERSIISTNQAIVGGTIKATEAFVCDRGSISEKPETFTVTTPMCNAHYSVLGYTCDPEARTYSCVAASRPAHSEWTGLAGYGQIWDGDVFAPIDSDPTYGVVAVTGECTYKCSAGFHTENGGDTCVSNTDLTTCVVDHGTGIRTWTTAWGACSVNSCNSGYVEQAGACVTDTCDGTPPSHTVSNASSQKYGTAWNYNTAAGLCTFKCDTNYQWDAPSSSCVAMKRNVTCGGAIATDASASTATTYQQTWDGNTNQWLPSVNWTQGAATCGYACNANYTWNGTVCVADTRTFACSNILPAHAEWNTVLSYSQTWGGNAWNPLDSTTSYSLTPSTTDCRFKCSSGYHTENSGSSCVANSAVCSITNGTGLKTWNDGSASWSVCMVTSCAPGYAEQSNQCVLDVCKGSVPANAEANGGQSVAATWHYDAAGSTCGFKCSTNYDWNGSACVGSTKVVSCGGSVLANATASTSTSYTQTYGAGGWTPSTSWSYGGASCGYACNAHYTWNGTNACVADQNVFTCASTKPTNSIWNTVPSYIQIWNGSAWSPANTTTSYSTTPSSTTCVYVCNTGYHTENSGTSCVSNTKSCTISNGTGQQTWNGSSWGSCMVTACNSNYVEQTNMCVADVCGGTVPTNATSNATGQTVTKNWGYNATAGQCTFKCDQHYTWNGGSACVADNNTFTCASTKPTNSIWNTVVNYTQTWNGSAWNPADSVTSYSTSPSSSACRYTCGSGYHTEDGGTSCISDTKSCIITNGSGQQAWSGGSWGSCTATSCNTNYTLSGNACIANSQNGTCSGSVPLNATASATTFPQTYNGSIYSPATTNYGYQTATCGYSCNTGFHTENSGVTCVADTRTCAITNGAGSQTWNGSGWPTCTVTSCNGGYVNSSNTCVLDVCGGTVPANATSNATGQTYTKNWGFNTTAGQCTFVCNAHYTWNSSACVADTQTLTCTAKPANTDWNNVASYTQTWNGSAWTPVSTSTTYNTSLSSTECRYKCSTGYHWNSGGSTCDADVISCALPAGASSATQTWNGTSYDVCKATACNSNYTLAAGACSANTQSATCGGSIIANATASTATTYTQTWNGSIWTPTTSWTQNGGTCGWTCSSGYNWNGSSCAAKVNGTCNNSVALGCSTGAGYTSDGGQTGCSTTHTWYCAGSNAGATSVQCSIANAVCINGSCPSVTNAYTTPTATCNAGNATAITGSGPWYWGCNSPNGGTSTSATACSVNKKVDCVGAWTGCSNGSQTYNISVNAANGGAGCPTANGATQSCGTTGSCSGTAGACAVGSPVSVVNNGCGSTTTWTCSGVSGGSSVACSANNAACPVNCSYNTYWGACNTTCGNGTQYLYYNITAAPQNGGSCAVSQDQYSGTSQGCYNASSVGTNLSGWSACSAACGGGTQSRTDACGNKYSQSCNTQACPTNCSYTTTGWSGCSASCGGGTQTYSYHITTAATNGGTCAVYEGQLAGSQACNTQGCPTNCSYSSVISESCSYDSCGNPSCSYWCTYNITTAATNGGSCPVYQGQSTGNNTCFGPTNCSYGYSYGSCSKSCGGGTQPYYANIYAAAENGGSCPVSPGQYLGSASCNTQACVTPTNCTYNTVAGSCSASCGGGTQAITYNILSAATGGGSCPVYQGQSAGSQSCNTQGCPVAGVCNNTTPLGCSTGSATSDNGSTSCGAYRTWYCSGVNGGSTSPQCSYYNGACGGGGGGGGGGCFLAGTPVTMADGSTRSIDMIKIGDSVLIYDEIAKMNTASPVTEVIKHDSQEQMIFTITLADGTVIRPNDEHPMYEAHQDTYIKMSDLYKEYLAGKTLGFKKQDGSTSDIAKITREQIVAPVYNIHVIGLSFYQYDPRFMYGIGHNYYVDGVLVHNMKVLIN